MLKKSLMGFMCQTGGEKVDVDCGKDLLWSISLY